MESQQHALCDITEMLMDLRRLVAAHGEFLANFRQHTLTEEPPDSLDERSLPHPRWHARPPDQQPVAVPPQCWTLPPSITQPPRGVKAEPLPRLCFDPPRFDGDNAQDWIQKIQNYYNYQYMPLHDRLHLTQYLFDHPASEWMVYWKENNKGKGWDEFLVAVKQRFKPDSHDEYVGRLPALHQTCQTVAGVQGASPRPTWTFRDDRQHIHNTASPVQVHDIISAEHPPRLMDQESFEANSRDSPQARDFVPNLVVELENIVVKAEDVIFNGPFDSGQPAAIIAMEETVNDVIVADALVAIETKVGGFIARSLYESRQSATFGVDDNAGDLFLDEFHTNTFEDNGAPPLIDRAQLGEVPLAIESLPIQNLLNGDRELCESRLSMGDGRSIPPRDNPLHFGRNPTIGWRLPLDRTTCSGHVATAPAMDSLLSWISTAVINTQPVFQSLSRPRREPRESWRHSDTEANWQVSPTLSTTSTQWGCEILPYDVKQGVLIFDPGDFMSIVEGVWGDATVLLNIYGDARTIPPDDPFSSRALNYGLSDIEVIGRESTDVNLKKRNDVDANGDELDENDELFHKNDFSMQTQAKLTACYYHRGPDLVVVVFSNGVFALYRMLDFVCLHLLSISREKITTAVLILPSTLRARWFSTVGELIGSSIQQILPKIISNISFMNLFDKEYLLF